VLDNVVVSGLILVIVWAMLVLGGSRSGICPVVNFWKKILKCLKSECNFILYIFLWTLTTDAAHIMVWYKHSKCLLIIGTRNYHIKDQRFSCVYVVYIKWWFFVEAKSLVTDILLHCLSQRACLRPTFCMT